MLDKTDYPNKKTIGDKIRESAGGYFKKVGTFTKEKLKAEAKARKEYEAKRKERAFLNSKKEAK